MREDNIVQTLDVQFLLSERHEIGKQRRMPSIIVDRGSWHLHHPSRVHRHARFAGVIVNVEIPHAQLVAAAAAQMDHAPVPRWDGVKIVITGAVLGVLPVATDLRGRGTVRRAAAARVRVGAQETTQLVGCDFRTAVRHAGG